MCHLPLTPSCHDCLLFNPLVGEANPTYGKPTVSRRPLVASKYTRSLCAWVRTRLTSVSNNKLTSDFSPMLHDRYGILKVLGKGTYGQVFLCHDTKTGSEVAIKVARRDPAYRRAAMNEIEALRALLYKDEILHMICYFEHRGCVCIVSEVLQMSLFDVLQMRKFHPLSFCDIRVIARRVLQGIAALHDIGYMHCDIKPENIMLRSSSKSVNEELDYGGTCLIDFGAVRHFHDNKYYDIQSLWYRAPEVFLHIPYTHQIDSWSVGCLLYELYTGEPLFYKSNPQELLDAISQTVGLPPDERIVPRLGHSTAHFMRQEERVDAEANLRRLIANSRGESEHCYTSYQTRVERSIIMDLILKLLEPDDRKRLSCADALNHALFTFQHWRQDSVLFIEPEGCRSEVCNVPCTALPDCCTSTCNIEPSGKSTVRWGKRDREPVAQRPQIAGGPSLHQHAPFPSCNGNGVHFTGIVSGSQGVVLAPSHPPLESSVSSSSARAFLPPLGYPAAVTAAHSAPYQIHRQQQAQLPQPILFGAHGCSFASIPRENTIMLPNGVDRSCFGAGCDTNGASCDGVAIGDRHHIPLQMIPVAQCSTDLMMYNFFLRDLPRPMIYVPS
uniref:Uncharacterized protein TCIL3000_10_8720 n=1 Tax=Trypanosoma congolense (strain IL3000) TaxID=1068625 RepID=G0UXH9_TRYCI|nr:unnamed protein product [Trypanosoma congolense IL3000]